MPTVTSKWPVWRATWCVCAAITTCALLCVAAVTGIAMLGSDTNTNALAASLAFTRQLRSYSISSISPARSVGYESAQGGLGDRLPLSEPLSLSLMACIEGLSPTARPVASDQYDDCRIGTNLRYDSYFPALILNVTTIEDIKAAVVCAASFDVNVVPMNGGHSFEGMSCTNDLLLHLDSFHALLSVVDSASGDKLVTVQSGIRLARLYGLVIQYSDGQKKTKYSITGSAGTSATPAATPSATPAATTSATTAATTSATTAATTSATPAATPAATGDNTYVVAGGTCPTVGVVGHTLCGGYGMLGRFVGLTSDQITGMLCYVMLCYAMLYYAMLCYAMLCCAMLCCAMLCYAVLCCAMLCCAMLCYVMLCCAMLCCAVLCYAAMLCYAMLCYAMLCYAMI
jgi:hypothetical protein